MICLVVSVRIILKFIWVYSKISKYNYPSSIAATYDSSGQVDYLDVMHQSENDFQNLTLLAGTLECAATILLF